ncbi:MAG: hypothetical protein AB7P03_18860 [Kofleriaceae bacterium]
MTLRFKTPLLAALCALAGVACSNDSTEQIVTGRVATSGAVAVRAITGNDVVTAARVQSDGTFTIALPAGHDYRLEVLTSAGARRLNAGTKGGSSFRVCHAVDPFDLGAIGHAAHGPDGGACPPGHGSGGGSSGTCTDPSGNCPEDPSLPPPCPNPDASGDCPNDPTPPPPPPCSDPNDPACGCDPAGNCEPVPPPPPPCTDPNDPACGCDPAGNCEPPPTPCTDPTEPCGCDSAGNCHPLPPPPPCTDPNDPYCKCDDVGNCPVPQPAPPWCVDPADPTCEDQCAIEPWYCGCPTEDVTCWPEPVPSPSCDPSSMAPQWLPKDFGCEEPASS